MFEQGLHRISDEQEKPQRVTVNERPEALASNTAEASESPDQGLRLLMMATLLNTPHHYEKKKKSSTKQQYSIKNITLYASCCYIGHCALIGWEVLSIVYSLSRETRIYPAILTSMRGHWAVLRALIVPTVPIKRLVWNALCEAAAYASWRPGDSGVLLWANMPPSHAWIHQDNGA